MRVMRIRRTTLYLFLSCLWGLFVLMSWTQQNPLELLNILGFGSLLLVPGLLTYLSLTPADSSVAAKRTRRLRRGLKKPKRVQSHQNFPAITHFSRIYYQNQTRSERRAELLRAQPLWYAIGLVIGFSLLELLLFVLLCNTILPHLHLHRSLDRHPLLIELSVLYAVVALTCWPRLKHRVVELSLHDFVQSVLDVAALLVSLLFVALAVMGAVSLNNGGNAVFTLVMLSLEAVYIGCLLVWRRRFHEQTFCWSVFMISLSLLLMTSLRGWYVTGHDIQHEFEVFLLTKDRGLWTMANLRDPYNACLSITMLPTILTNTLHIGDPYVYKILFQIIFAYVPVSIYLLVRRYLSPAKSLLAVLYFVSFPTYFTDMPFLNRQEIAFLFLALSLLVVGDQRWKLSTRRWLFIAFGIGIVLSHYSTTYSYLFILVLTVCCRPVYYWLAGQLGRLKVFKASSIEVLNAATPRLEPTITVTAVVILVVLGILWNGVLTGTANAATSVVSKTVSSVVDGYKTDVRSSDVTYSLFSPTSDTPQQALKDYVKNVVNPQRASAPPGTYYAAAATDMSSVKAQPPYDSPLTSVGHLLSKTGLNIGNFDYQLKQSYAKLLQLLIFIGLVYALFRKRYSMAVGAEFLLLSLASIVFVLLQVVLPDLSVSYGLLRAFQQALMVLALFLVIGSFVVTIPLPGRLLKMAIPSSIALVFFLASTGVIPQLLGGYLPQLNLNNNGEYYNDYYTHKSELVAMDWLNNQVLSGPRKGSQTSVVQVDIFELGKLSTYASSKLTMLGGLYPGLIRQNAYVLLGYATVTQQQAYLSYDGDQVTYNYPTQFLDQQKNLVYTDGGTEIYR